MAALTFHWEGKGRIEAEIGTISLAILTSCFQAMRASAFALAPGQRRYKKIFRGSHKPNSHQNSHSTKIRMAAILASLHLIDFI
ncbi:MAG: hypothetical protein ABSD61_03240 [Terracidiphilus sp.]